jgi:hypothetical protein
LSRKFYSCLLRGGGALLTAYSCIQSQSSEIPQISPCSTLVIKKIQFMSLRAQLGFIRTLQQIIQLCSIPISQLPSITFLLTFCG